MVKIYFANIWLLLWIFSKSLFAQQQVDKLLREANNAYNKKEYTKVIGYVTSYIKKYSSPIPYAYQLRGKCYYELGEYQHAISDFEKVIELSQSPSSEVYLLLAKSYKQTGKYLQAIRYFHICLQGNDKSEIHKEIAECYQQINQQERAKENWQLAQQQEFATLVLPFEKWDQCSHLLSEARSLAEGGSYAQAETTLTEIVEKYYCQKSYKKYKEVFDLRGQVRMRLRKYWEALSDFDQSLKIQPLDAWTYNQRGLAKKALQQWKEAEEDFQKAIELDPISPARDNLVKLQKFLKGNTNSIDDKKGPHISITSPRVTEINTLVADLVHFSGGYLKISGAAEDVNGIQEVLVNNYQANLTPVDDFYKHCTFTAFIPISNGENVVTILAKDFHNNQTRITYKLSSERKPTSAQLNYQKLHESIRCYALVIGNDTYRYWPNLNNPVLDATALAQILKDSYGFQVELLLNLNKDQIEQKLQEWSSKRYYNPTDQLLVFFAGHGFYSEQAEQGFFIPSDGLSSRANNPYSSWISFEYIRQTLEHSNCRHVFLIMDTCFSGTFSPLVARLRGSEEMNMSAENLIFSKMQLITRKFLTSGGKEYVPDGRPGAHSPFMASLLSILRTKKELIGGLLTTRYLQRCSK